VRAIRGSHAVALVGGKLECCVPDLLPTCQESCALIQHWPVAGLGYGFANIEWRRNWIVLAMQHKLARCTRIRRKRPNIPGNPFALGPQDLQRLILLRGGLDDATTR
jgi:hypothetical protein